MKHHLNLQLWLGRSPSDSFFCLLLFLVLFLFPLRCCDGDIVNSQTAVTVDDSFALAENSVELSVQLSDSGLGVGEKEGGR